MPAWPLRLVIATLTLLLSASALASLPVVTMESAGDYLGERTQVLAGIDESYTIEQIRDLPADQWRAGTQEIPSFGYSSDSFWFRFSLHNTEEQAVDLILELGYSLLDEVEFFQFEDDRQVNHIVSGDRIPFSERGVQHRSFAFPVDIGPGETHEIYIRTRSSSSMQVPLQLWHAQEFYEGDQLALIGNGLYYGIALVMAFYNFFLFLRLRDPAYIYYVLYVCTFVLIQSTISGFSFQFLWPDSPQLNEKAISVLVPMVVVWAALFLRRSLLVPGSHPRFEISWATLSISCGALAFLSIFLPYQLSIKAGIFLGMMACILALYMSYYIWLKHHHKYAAYVSVAWSVFLLGTVVLSLNKFGVIPRTFLTESAAQIGSALEIILLSYALAERVHDAHRQQLQAEFSAREANERLLHLEREHRIQLEDKVRQQTEDLHQALGRVEKLNEELLDLSNTDQLTGARNRRFFDTCLESELQRSQRTGREVSLLMLDIDHFKQVNDVHGHGIGDLCLQAVVAAISSQLNRAQDEVCRYGGEEIAIILPETGAEGAYLLAERIRCAIEELQVDTEAGLLNVTASLGISTSQPVKGLTPQTLLAEADKALYASKEAGRNQVTVFGSPGLGQEERNSPGQISS